MMQILRFIKNISVLTKSLLSAAIAFSACIGYFISGHNSAAEYLIVFISVYLLSSGASAYNQFAERRTDKLMSRTARRPIPAGNISPLQSIVISILLITAGAFTLYYLSVTAMLLGLLNFIIYNFIYTPLKYKTGFALLAGGLVGALPPLIGWYSSGEMILKPSIIYFSAFMFLWQIPHFMILNLKYKEQYQSAGIKTISDLFNIKQIRILLVIWLISTCLMSLMFPLAGLITSSFQFYLLLILNISIISVFVYVIFIKERAINTFQRIVNLPFAIFNIFIHVYLFFTFIILLGGKL